MGGGGGGGVSGVRRTVSYYFFSCGHGGTRNHFEIEFGNNSKTYTCALKKLLFYLAQLAHLRVFIWKIFISLWWDPSKIK